VIVFLAQLLFWRWLLRSAIRLARWAVAAVVMIAAAPVTTVTVTAVTIAWLRGWPPVRLRHAAAWSLPMTAVYLTARAVTARSWQAALAAPYLDWRAGWHAVSLGATGTAFVLCAPVAVPAGLLIASWAWASRIYRIETGLSGKTATAPVIFDHRQWTRQARAARGRNAAPGNVPLTDRRGRIVIGGTIRAVGHPWRPVLAVPFQAMARHQVIIGSSGCCPALKMPTGASLTAPTGGAGKPRRPGGWRGFRGGGVAPGRHGAGLVVGDFADGGAGCFLVDDGLAGRVGGDEGCDGEVVDGPWVAARGGVNERGSVVAEQGVGAPGELDVMSDVTGCLGRGHGRHGVA